MAPVVVYVARQRVSQERANSLSILYRVERESLESGSPWR